MRRRSSFIHRTLRAAAPLFGLALALPLLAQAEGGAVYRLRIKSAIHPVAAEMVADAVAEADQARAAALVIELDTPGGLVSSTREISTAILGARTPVVVYVSPSGAQAASAGFFILMSADVAAMAPSTNTGAAHPISSEGEIEGIPGKKAEEDAAANIRTLAARMGRNVELAEKAVVESDSYTESEALDGKLIEVVAPSLPKLLEALDGREIKKGDRTVKLATAGAQVVEVETSAWRRALGVLADPNIAYIFLTLGFLGLYFELMNPGAVLPGVLGGIFLLLAFFGLSVLPVNYAGLALILLAIVLFIAEVKITSYGMLTVAGVISLVLGSLMLFKTAEPALRVSISLIVTLALASLLVVGFLLTFALRARLRPVTTGREGLVGLSGTARSALAPQGKVLVFGEIWDAVAEDPVSSGEEVEVVRVDNMTLVVRRRRAGDN